MTIQLIKGQFSAKEAIDLITQMVNIKIKFQEDKIHSDTNEEDVKMREKRIKQLQKELFEVRHQINNATKAVNVDATINIDNY